MRLAPAVFLDRDGVLNTLASDPDSGLPESPLDPEQVALIDGAAGALCDLRELGYVLVVVSNQPPAAKGKASLADLHAVHARVAKLLQAAGASPDAWRYCPHHPDGVVDGLSGPCMCRKPAPGLLHSAALELGLDLGRSWMIGDSGSDIDAGRAAGCSTLLIEHPPSAHRRKGAAGADLVAPDLAAGAKHLGPPSVG